MIPNLSAGTGPAAAILIGGVFFLVGEKFLGIIIIMAGIGLSFMWSRRF
jgi:hypothetical protein